MPYIQASSVQWRNTNMYIHKYTRKEYMKDTDRQTRTDRQLLLLSTGWTASSTLWIRRPPREQKIQGSNPALDRIFPGWAIPVTSKVATLSGTWWYRVRAGTGQPRVSILWLGEAESLICNFYLSVAAYKCVRADPSLTYTSMLLGH